LYIEQDDFMENPPPKYFRLAPGREVRLKNAYFIKCERVVKDEKTGRVIELCCTYDPETKGGNAPDGRKVKGTIHWVSAERSIPAQVRLYDHLFTVPNPWEEEDLFSVVNKDSLEVLDECRIEENIAGGKPGDRFQFLRLGYFCVDKDSKEGAPVFNRTVTLKDTWAKLASSFRIP
jgi:glutaminyl-tRNA synthetase